MMDKRRGGGMRRKKVCQFCADKTERIDYKDVEKLRKYETNGGKKIDSESKPSQWTKDYEDLPVPTRSGYAFTGWYSDKKLTKLITDDVKVNISLVTIYAGWRKVSVPGGNEPQADRLYC